MKIEKKVLKNNNGEIKLVPQNLDDIWHLKHIIDRNDLVSSYTWRDISNSTDKIRPDKQEKKKIWLGIEVEETEFHKFSNRLRVTGKIRVGTDLAQYHTLNIEPGIEVSIFKDEWKKDQLERIDDAVRASNQPKVIIITIEEGEASVGILRQYGIDESFNISLSSGKSGGESKRAEFFTDLLKQIINLFNDWTKIVIAGPGFTKNDLYQFIKERYPQFVDSITLENTSSIGISGFQEVLRRGAIEKIINENRLSKETRYIDILLKEIATDGLATYGMNDVKKANEFGAIDTLLILDEFLREERGSNDIDSFLKEVEEKGGKLIIFSSDFEPGKKLAGLGGIAAILRYKIT
ncbi:MAG: mRNA surveillance protein pelota [Candidatus Methanoliparum thermophilum]|uniref:Protein pelota homolog n=1 Tax=Methanoliparum thermophilum TaxID=2491083 RepID=A0A520KT90_METT2|nr:mRNA surveillance protein pelota [Candidatus Methanoliparum sp. LAM-1]RZN64638.1 MAG: mRNA surveillance protein pelota [Candidatus Methanoliparum thermophilum]BDC35736.1 mRNA surveillance protein Pelota [Candidatus Methanoliparum sp. LAM-1]